jgi:hypothetical protein
MMPSKSPLPKIFCLPWFTFLACYLAISVDEAYRYVSMKVPQATGQDQHPVKKGEMTGQIILGVVK